MLATIRSSCINGIEATAVDVEVEVQSRTDPNQRRFTIIGLGDSAVREARDRVEAALKHLGFRIPEQVLVNLSPAEIKKEGSSFDLAIAVGILAASGQIEFKKTFGRAFHGELGLDGRLKKVRGIVAQTIAVLERGVSESFVPKYNYSEANLIDGISVVGAESLDQVVGVLRGDITDMDNEADDMAAEFKPFGSLSEVRGQAQAKRALILAAAGAHNLLFIGVPGAGKSMLASRLPNILPPLTPEEQLEVVRVHSVAGLDIRPYLNSYRPFRAPHHGISEAGLMGGGSNPRPGEVSLAHLGILFLDEFPEYRRGVLESLRAPLEAGKVRITRAKASVEFPARFQLIAAMNPCPCGRLGVSGISCLCSSSAIQAYLKKLSQPILDRIDLHVNLTPVPIEDLSLGNLEYNLDYDREIQTKVIAARNLALARSGKANAFLSNQEIKNSLCANQRAKSLIEKLAEKRKLSARGYFRLLKLARTIADYEQSNEVLEEFVAEAAGYRSLDVLQGYLK